MGIWRNGKMTGLMDLQLLPHSTQWDKYFVIKTQQLLEVTEIHTQTLSVVPQIWHAHFWGFRTELLSATINDVTWRQLSITDVLTSNQCNIYKVHNNHYRGTSAASSHAMTRTAHMLVLRPVIMYHVQTQSYSQSVKTILEVDSWPNIN